MSKQHEHKFRRIRAICSKCQSISPDKKYACRKKPGHIAWCKALLPDRQEWCRKCNQYIDENALIHICGDI